MALKRVCCQKMYFYKRPQYLTCPECHYRTSLNSFTCPKCGHRYKGRAPKVTERDQEVAELLLGGLTHAESARRLGTSRQYVHQVARKLKIVDEVAQQKELRELSEYTEGLRQKIRGCKFCSDNFLPIPQRGKQYYCSPKCVYKARLRTVRAAMRRYFARKKGI